MQFDNIKMSDSELSKLIDRFGEVDAMDRIEQLHLQMHAHGYKYKSHYHAVLAWARKDAAGGRSFPQKPALAVIAAPICHEALRLKAEAIHSMFKRDFERGLRKSLPTMQEVLEYVGTS